MCIILELFSSKMDISVVHSMQNFRQLADCVRLRIFNERTEDDNIDADIKTHLTIYTC